MRMKMMKISMLLLWILVFASCSGDFERETDNISSRMGQVTFLFGLQEDDAFIVQTRSGSQEQIARMWYAVADKEGKIIKPLYQKLENDFSKLTIEGLQQGDYTLVFLATTSVEEEAGEAIKEPTYLSDDWLMNLTEKAPLDAVYFIKDRIADRKRSGSGITVCNIGTLCGKSGRRLEAVIRLYVEIYPKD